MKRAAAIALALAPLCANAEFLTGNELLSRMNGDNGLPMMALGYVAGVFDTTVFVLHCAPATVTLGQVRDMVKNDLLAIPEKRHMNADHLVITTLKTNWPCKNKGKEI